MSASSVLLVAASIVAAEGGTATIDAGSSQHLEPGDRGQAFYELIVDGVPKRIEVGPIVVVAATDGTATVSSESGSLLRPGYRVELRLPVDRMPTLSDVGRGLVPSPESPEQDELKRPVSVPAVPSEPMEPGLSKPLRDLPPSPPTRQEEPVVPENYPEHTLPAVRVDPEPREEEPADDVGEGLVPSQETPTSAPPVPARDVVYVSSGSYSVGLDPSDAQFFNQTPRHEVDIVGFSIDRLPRGEGRPTGLTFDQVQAHCEKLGLRLPTEQEWEVAAQVPGFVVEPGVFEWTASWYEAYPGNSRSEDEYGATHRVLRGVSDWSDESLHTRRFMKPNQTNSRVGFRCVKDIE